MKRHHVAIATTIRAGSEEHALESIAPQVLTDANDDATEQRINLSPRFARLASRAPEPDAARSAAEHTLVLVGQLDRVSTHTLEAEIERLCEAGITSITLDLNELTGIDTTGVAVVVFRAKWCKKRGCELALVGGSSAVQHAFERAGLLGEVPFKDASSTTSS